MRSVSNRYGASMTHLTTEQLQAIQTKVDSMLEAIIERLEGSRQLQAAGLVESRLIRLAF